MLKKGFLILVLVTCALAAGCGSGTTAVEIAESYGVLKNRKVVSIIQSGQADAMIEQGIVRVRNRTAGRGKKRILVTEYIISGKVYRVEVRRGIDPTKNISRGHVRYATSQYGSDHKEIYATHLSSVWGALRNHSFEARPEVAYRAWRGLDRMVRGVKVSKGLTPNWESSQNDMTLCIRTKDWPIATMWFRGLVSDARTDDSRGFAWDNSSEGEGSPASSGQTTCDGRWVIESAGPGVQGQGTVVGGRTHFINIKLYKAIGS